MNARNIPELWIYTWAEQAGPKIALKYNVFMKQVRKDGHDGK